MIQQEMTPLERRAAISLASIFSTRMLGLFMILPVFSLYADELLGVTPVLIGVAIGIYGLTQALLQIPFGMLSDRIGRKPVIAAGLLIFAAGSVVAALADSITGVIIGRAMQGGGAIAAAVMALAADLTREEHRTKAMAIIGASIGVSFAFSLVAGPVLDGWIGVSGIFWLTALLALAGIFILFFAVPQPVESRFHRDAEPVPAQFREILRDRQLLRLNLGIFVLHMILTSTFVALPFALRDHVGLNVADHWLLYLPVVLLALGVMVPFVIMAEKRRRMKAVFVGAIAVIAVTELWLSFAHSSLIAVSISLFLFFSAFNVLEATLPSLIAKTAPPDKKGTAMGLYSSSQFIGAFVGGISGGVLYGAFGPAGVFLFCGLAAALWGLVAITMRNPRFLGTYMINVGSIDETRGQQLTEALAAIPGVEETVVIVEDGVAYLKVDNSVLDRDAVNRYSIDES